MASSPARENFDNGYRTGTAPWVIGEPQPAVLELEREGRFRGKVLDVGCGAGEHTLHLAGLGYDVLGVDFSPFALELAKANAAARGIEARFEVADAMRLGGEPRYDTVLDSALFHVFAPEDQLAYARSLHAVTKPGGVVHVLALADTEPSFGPQVSETAIRTAFAEGWEVAELGLSRYRGWVNERAAPLVGEPVGTVVDSAAWLARIRRT
ncbi:class I SAM-dependent methyltransferase [Amycolatopsis sp. CA-230715]|uniref:class I SAM-dependent methyltransferase n=1 Tax=Amycolatopsis sp. CA-230715 TaxID=2745196 RepID=UPI001C02C3FA|nr:class I SAM-dependent methyltransferase [Amycolatopsis sp. CA-230715]QWF83956.1 Ubiquinone biosynthesis O-methyltransferase [Amycolatopsis sp. CA-230715]